MREKAVSVFTVDSKLNVEKSDLIRGRTKSIGLIADRYGRWHYEVTCSGRNARENVGKGERTRIEVKCVRTIIISAVLQIGSSLVRSQLVSMDFSLT